jgi:serine/threonine protein kinase
MSIPPIIPMPEIERRIAWILAHPGISERLKDALSKALDRDPIDVANDVELLIHLLRPWTTARIDQLLSMTDNS